MKKIFTILILAAFISVQVSIAWADEMFEGSNIPVIQTNSQNIKIKNSNSSKQQTIMRGAMLDKQINRLNEIPVSNIFFEQSKNEEGIGYIKKVEKGQKEDSILDKLDRTYELCNFIKGDTINNRRIKSILQAYGFERIDKYSKNDNKYVRFDLPDGNYAIALKHSSHNKYVYFYVAEYSKDGTLIGLIYVTVGNQLFHNNDYQKWDFLDSEKTDQYGKKIEITEYRYGYNTSPSNMGARRYLRILSLNNNIRQYLFTSGSKLSCVQIDNDVYITKNTDNVLLNLPDKKLIEAYNEIKEPLSIDNLKYIKIKKNLNKVAVTNSAGKQEYIYVNNEGVIKKVSKSIVDKNLEGLFDNKSFFNEIKDFKVKTISDTNVNKVLANYGYKTTTKDIANNRHYLKMDLLDGDYILIRRRPYVTWLAEYSKDGKLMGLIKIITGANRYDNSQKVSFFEYRLGYNTNSEKEMGLKHVLFIRVEKDKSISEQYIYNSEGELLCAQENDNTYLAESVRNMLLVEPKDEIKAINKTAIKDNIGSWLDDALIAGATGEGNMPLLVKVALYPLALVSTPFVLFAWGFGWNGFTKKKSPDFFE